MNTSGTFLGLAVSLLLGFAVFIVTAVFDSRAQVRDQRDRVELSLSVQAASFRGNLEKHRQGAVLTARHPAMIELAINPSNADSLRIAKQLYALTDIDALFVLGPSETFILKEPAHATVDLTEATMARALSFAWQGSLGRGLIGTDFVFAAPVFSERKVVAVALSRFDLGEATAALDLSTNEIRLLSPEGRELYANSQVGQGAEVIEKPMPDLEMVMVARPGSRLTLRDWGGRALAFGALAFSLAFVMAQLILRRHNLLERARRREVEAMVLEAKVAERTKELEAAQASIVQAGKLALLGQVAASISHEINQPLGAIRNYAANAQTFLSKDRIDKAEDNLGRILTQTDRVSRIVGNLRSFVTGRPQEVQPVTLGPIIDEARDAVLSRFPVANAGLRVDVDPEIRLVAGAVRLEQVLYNLLVNAWIAVQEEATPEVLLAQEQQDDGMIALYVEDNGPGVPEAITDGLFDAFVSTRSDLEGLGLGLAIARQFMETMGGTLDLEPSKSLGGARFVLRVPSVPRALNAGGVV